jgi:hypothetical protein
VALKSDIEGRTEDQTLNSEVVSVANMSARRPWIVGADLRSGWRSLGSVWAVRRAEMGTIRMVLSD